METVTDALNIQCSAQVSAEAKASFKAMIQQILDSSPSDSTAKVELIAGEQGEVAATVHIQSKDVDFKAAKTGGVELALKSVRTELSRQIALWREQRSVEAAS